MTSHVNTIVMEVFCTYEKLELSQVRYMSISRNVDWSGILHSEGVLIIVDLKIYIGKEN